MELWVVTIAIGLITYAQRLSFIMFTGERVVPERLLRALRLLPAAVLAAIIVPELALRDGALALSLDNARLLAGLLAILVAWRTRNVFLTILSGMTLLLLLQGLQG